MKFPPPLLLLPFHGNRNHRNRVEIQHERIQSASEIPRTETSCTQTKIHYLYTNMHATKQSRGISDSSAGVTIAIDLYNRGVISNWTYENVWYTTEYFSLPQGSLRSSIGILGTAETMEGIVSSSLKQMPRTFD